MPKTMRIDTRRRGAGLALGVAVAAVVLLSVVVGLNTPVPPGPTPARSDVAAATFVNGPIVYSEILDADGSWLIERRLDGHSLPRRVAVRTDVDYGRTWSVDPRGTMAIALVPAGGDQRLEAIAIADGTDLWQLTIPNAQLDEAVWSADGRRIAMLSRPDDAGPVEAFVIDARDGHLLRAIVPDDAVIQAFDADDALILRQRIDPVRAAAPSWTFFRIDPATNVVERLVVPPPVGPGASDTDDADPAHGFGVIATPGQNDQGTAVKVWPLAGGAARTLAVLPSIDRLSIDPGGDGVAISSKQSIRFVTWDGRAADLWAGQDPIGSFGWSAGGDYLGITTDRRAPNLIVVERATGRVVELPQAEPVAESLLVRIVGGVPLPERALPAAEPTPTPTPAPSGPDLGGAPALAAAWFDVAGGRIVLHVDRLVPTTEGGVRIAGSMTPIDLGPAPGEDEGGPVVSVLPRPRSAEMLVWIQSPDRGRGWLWGGMTGAGRDVGLPTDWPAPVDTVAWRSDGGALAGHAIVTAPSGEASTTFVVAEIGGRRSTVVPAPEEYDQLEGWWSSTELRVGHQVCTEGCPGRFAYSARLRIRDGHLAQLTPADRGRGAIDQVLPDGHGGLVMSAINDDTADDIQIDWPANLASREGPTPIGFAADRQAILVLNHAADATDVYRVADPAGRAVGGRLLDPTPVLLGHLAGRSLDVRVSPDERWGITVDRVETVRLVELATDRAWAVDRDRVLEWWPAGG
jgi:hypothetical protein